MASLGDVLVEVGADLSDFERAMDELERRTRRTSSQIGSRFSDMERYIRRYEQISASRLRNLPDHLRPFAESIDTTRREIRRMGHESTQSINEMAQAAVNSRVGWESLTSVTSSGRDAINTIREMGEETRRTRLAVLGLNETGTVAISTEESTRQLQNFQRRVDETRRHLEALRDAGDMGSYVAGMEQLERQMRDVNDAMVAASRGGQAYLSQLQRLGIITSDLGNRTAVAMERMRESFINSNDMMQARATQTSKIIDNLARMNVRGLDQQFLRIADHLERTARAGSVANVALNEVGRNASMKQIMDQVRLINAGIMRMQMTSMAAGIGFAALSFGIFQLAKENEQLSASIEQFASTWKSALGPFIDSWAFIASKIIDAGTAVGELIVKMNELNPAISQAMFWIAYLTVGLTALLAPLAIGISRTGSFAVAFNQLWMVIGPAVQGLLAVVGTALLVATAIVGATLAIKAMWEESEQLRSVVTSVWESVKAMILAAVQPIIAKWQELKTQLSALVAEMTGGTGTMSDLWKVLGDFLAMVIEKIASVVLPILSTAFEVMSTIICAVIDVLIATVKWMRDQWEKHGDEISAIVKKLWGYIETAFNAVATYIKQIMPQIVSTVKSSFELIKTAIDLVMKYIVPAVSNAFQWIWDKIGWIMPIIVSMVKDSWENVKNIISNVLNIIQNAISLFSNILSGNWSAAWENVKQILSSAVKVLYNWVELWILGKVLGIFKGIGGKIGSALSDVAEMMAKPFKAGYEKVKGWVDKVLGLVSSMKNAISGVADAVGNFLTGGSGAGSGGSGGSSRSRSVDIHANATGNVFTGASLLGGNQLVGEAGAEVVMPISRKRYMKPYANMVADLLGTNDGSRGNGGGITQNITINSPTPLSPADIARKNLQTARRLALEWEV